MIKNKVSTLGYFLKRLRDCGFIAIKVYDKYSFQDSRKWTIIVDPGGRSVGITCYQNKDYNGDVFFEINDGGTLYPKNYNLKTNSMEIIITSLLEKGVNQKAEDSEFVKKA